MTSTAEAALSDLRQLPAAAPRDGLQLVEIGLAPATADYVTTWQLQRAIHEQVVAGARPDTVLLLEHTAVYTAGKRTDDAERPVDGTPVVDVDRGGKITWHGPGQLVGYPIVRLPSPVDVVAHVRRLEEVMIRTCAELGLATTRVEGRSGVWVRGDGTDGPASQDRKLGQIGVRVSREVTLHGFALNCDCDLSWGQVIIPCGIADAGITSLSRELGRDVTVREVVPVIERHLRDLLG